MRCVVAVPVYLVLVAVMVAVGVVASGVVASVLLPLSVQEGESASDISYTYTVGEGKVTIHITNKRMVDARVDVALVTRSGRVVTVCPWGYATSPSASRGAGGPLTLLGLRVRGGETLTIVCYVDDVREVRVYGYGVPYSRGGVRATTGRLPGVYTTASGGFDIGRLWGGGRCLRYRLPVTVIVDDEYAPAYVELELSARTLPDDIWWFIRAHTRRDLNDVLVVGVDGREYPTRAERRNGKIIVYFRVDRLEPGVHRFHLYFGNPDLEEPPHPLRGGVPGERVRTGSLRYHLSSNAYPAYLVPEANWLPDSAAPRFGLAVTEDRGEFAKWRLGLRRGEDGVVRKLIGEAMGNLVAFPVGTVGAQERYRSYRHLKPRTDLGWAPWGAVAVVPLPSVGRVAKGTGVTGELWVASDDGSAAYIVAVGSDRVRVEQVYDRVYRGQPPRYWNHPAKRFHIDLDTLPSSTVYLVLLVQNGLYAGSGPGYLDFKLALWYVEDVGEPADRQQSSPNMIRVRGRLVVDLGSKIVKPGSRVAEFHYDVSKYIFRGALLTVELVSINDVTSRYYIVSTSNPGQVFWAPWPKNYIARGVVRESKTVTVDVTDIVGARERGVFYVGVSTYIGSWRVTVKLVLLG